MRRILLSLLGMLICCKAFGQQAQIDSLKQALTTTTDTARVKVLYALASITLKSGEYSQAISYAQRGLEESKKAGWLWGQAEGLEMLGMLYTRNGNFIQAQQNILSTLPLWRQLRQTQRETQAMLYVANLLSENHQISQALTWNKRALAAARTAHDSVSLQLAYMGLGLCYTRQQNPAAAIPYSKQALVLTQLDQGGVTVRNAYAHNNLADNYILTNQSRKALPHLFKAIRLARKLNNQAGETIFEGTLAQAYEKLGNLDIAIYHALNARRLSLKFKDTPLLINLNQLLDTLYVRQGNYRLAYRYGTENRRLEAQARRQEQEQKVAEVQGRYDTKEKERNIQLLTQQNQIARLATLQQRTLRNAALIIVGLLLLAMGILLNRYLLRQRTVRQLNEQKQVLEVRDQEKELLLREKTLLLQEVHHRVKNNLQMVLSLLNTQVNTLEEPAAIEAIRDSQSRVQTMALIHQNLYQTENLACIDMTRYFTELTEAIVRAFRTEAAAVTLTLDVSPLQLNTHTVVPLGLIVNELVTNALKYAFPAGRPDKQLRVHLRQQTTGSYQLVVADNGVGLSTTLVPAKVASLGLRLVAGLAQQMKAVLEVQSKEGAEFTLTFQEMPAVATSYT